MPGPGGRWAIEVSGGKLRQVVPHLGSALRDAEECQEASYREAGECSWRSEMPIEGAKRPGMESETCPMVGIRSGRKEMGRKRKAKAKAKGSQ